VILLISGLCDSCRVQANAAFVAAVPDSQRGPAFGPALGGMQVGLGAAMLAAGAAAQPTGPWLAIAAAGTADALAAALISSQRGATGDLLSSMRCYA